MSPVAGVVVQAADIPAEQTVAGVNVRTLVDTSGEEPGLVRRMVDLSPLARFSGSAAAGGELWFVIAGTGQLIVTGQPAIALNLDRGVLLPPDSPYEVRAAREDSLRLDTVSLPRLQHDPAHDDPKARDFADCEVETTGNRQFRVLFGPGHDCAVATQFVGEIPPGRAPDHSHPYDEVVLILAGDGIAQIRIHSPLRGATVGDDNGLRPVRVASGWGLSP